jgi:hypothetical protein
MTEEGKGEERKKCGWSWSTVRNAERSKDRGHGEAMTEDRARATLTE